MATALTSEIFPTILDGTFFKVVTNDNGKITAKCMNCIVDKNISGTIEATSNFKRHLKRCHPEQLTIYDDRKKDELSNLKKKKLEAAIKSTGNSKSAQPSMRTFVTITKGTSNPKRTNIDRWTIKFIVNGMHPLTTVEEKEFIGFAKALDSNCKLMSRRTLGRAIDDEVIHMTTVLKRLIADIKYLCITADAWTCGGQSRGFMGITLHWINGALERESAALACRRFKGIHSYDRVAASISGILAEYQVLIERVVAAVTDNGSNFVKAFLEFGHSFVTMEPHEEESSESESESENSSLTREPEDILDFEVLGDVIELGPESETRVNPILRLPPHIRCASHTLSLICVQDIKEVSGRLHKSSFAKCFGIWNKIGRSTKASEAVREICGKLLIRPCTTRWNSLYDSVASLLEHSSKLPTICGALNVPGFSENELKYLAEYKLCLCPVAVALDRLQGNTFYGTLIPTLLTVQSKLNDISTNGNLIYCTDLVHALLQGLVKRFGDHLALAPVHNNAIFAAISNPYFKLRWIPHERMEDLREFFLNELCTLNEYQECDEAMTTNTEQQKDDDFFQFTNQSTQESSRDSHSNKLRLQCHQYFEDTDKTVAVLNSYPAVKAMFVKYNTPIPSSAPVERLFNYGGMILRPNRRGLSDKNFEQLMLLKANSTLW